MKMTVQWNKRTNPMVTFIDKRY